MLIDGWRIRAWRELVSKECVRASLRSEQPANSELDRAGGIRPILQVQEVQRKCSGRREKTHPRGSAEKKLLKSGPAVDTCEKSELLKYFFCLGVQKSTGRAGSPASGGTLGGARGDFAGGPRPAERAAGGAGPRGRGGGGRRLCGRQEEAAGVLAADSTREVEAEKTSQGVRARVHGGAGQAAQGLCVHFLQKEPVAQRGPPRLWPLLSVAMDRGSDGLAACACLQRAKLGNVEALPDPACGVSNDVTLGLQRTGLWAHSALMLAVWTPVRGGRRQPVELLQECAWSQRARQRLKHEQASAFPSRQLRHTHHTTSVQRYAAQRSRTLPHFGPARD